MKTIWGLFLLLLSARTSAMEPTLILDDFEQVLSWDVKEWGDGGTLSLDTQYVSQGKKSSRLQFFALDAEKAQGLTLCLLNI